MKNKFNEIYKIELRVEIHDLIRKVSFYVCMNGNIKLKNEVFGKKVTFQSKGVSLNVVVVEELNFLTRFL